MKLNESSSKPIFIKIAEWTEDEILKGNIMEGDKIFSQIEFAKIFDINPITAGKGVSLLEARGIVVKKRGLGMFVSDNAKATIYEYRKNEELIGIIDDLINQANVLEVGYESLIKIIKKRIEDNEVKNVKD